jgi:hypothetical protein
MRDKSLMPTSVSPPDDDFPADVFFWVKFAPSELPRSVRLKRFLKCMGRAWQMRVRAFTDKEEKPPHEVHPE